MSNSFTLDFQYQINYRSSDILHFGINFILGFREFPIRVFNGGSADISPRSSGTFTFQSPTPLSISITNSSLFSAEGLDDLQLEMLYSDASKFNEYTFRMGSVGIKQVIEFSSNDGSLDRFFSTERFTVISDVIATVTIDDVKTRLRSKPNNIKLGKQYGETILLSWQEAS